MYRELVIPQRTIMTPGPVEAEPRVLRIMSAPILGQYDPNFLQIMDETMELIRYIFQTKNHQAFTVDGTARAGIEAVLSGIIEPGDKVYVPIFGRFGHLLTEISKRAGGDVYTTEIEWGKTYEFEDLKKEIMKVNPKVVAMVHGETSTGRMQPLEELGKFCRENDILLVVDAVATLTGAEFKTDDWNIDAVITGTQKCLSVPTGMAPLTYNERVEKILKERRKVEQGLQFDSHNDRMISTNYLDLSQIQEYWSPSRLNHHTEATTMLYALREGLRIIREEGLEARIARHSLNEKALVAGIEAMGLEVFGDKVNKMPTVTCVSVPEGIKESEIRMGMIEDFGVEIAAAFGSLSGKIWRVGSMGYSSRKENVLRVLSALEATLIRKGAKVNRGEALQAALDIYDEQK
ncbi:alanine--glyoxylate aminotransferase family protein [Tissierella sp.]|uniref:pyridoxal-phosphate-dependent aminotransferase family protein n=1 Tax=Tissierella sp. TaxID=41274 RepID=UPI0028A97184|nr:alanine--glyoxylate aminotransferase family protein [Tissierella sp.]